MNHILRIPLRMAAAGIAVAVGTFSTSAAEPAPATVSAGDLAARLSALRHDGASYVRLRLEVQEPAGTTKTTLQLEIKALSTRAATDLVYKVLWPKERKGEAVLLRKSAGRAATGTRFVPPATLRSIDSSQMKEPLFGSELSYEDVIDNFFDWDNQEIVGTEAVGRVPCQILESKPGKGDRSSYSKVRSWIDTRRLVPLRVEKYLSNQPARRIETTRVVTDDKGRHIPANLTITTPRKNSATELDGSRIKHDVTFSDREFTPEALQEMEQAR
jgi:outer membrane lipoprotein-sorting protein